MNEAKEKLKKVEIYLDELEQKILSHKEQINDLLSTLYLIKHEIDTQGKPIQEIIWIMAAKEVGADKKEMDSRTRNREVVTARQITWKILFDNKYGSLFKIGKEIGGYSHSNVLQGIRSLNGLIDVDSKVRESYNKISYRATKMLNNLKDKK